MNYNRQYLTIKISGEGTRGQIKHRLHDVIRALEDDEENLDGKTLEDDILITEISAVYDPRFETN